MADIQYKSNAKQIKSEEEKAKLRALEKIGILVEGRTARNTPVNTGRLRNSITHAVDDDYSLVGSPLDYALPVEMGSSKQAPNGYLRPAVNESTGDIKNIIEQEYGK